MFLGTRGYKFLRNFPYRSMASLSYNFETIKVHSPSKYVQHVEINNPKKLNAMSATFFRELKECFDSLHVDPDCRAVVLSGAGKYFTSGIDLTLLMSVAQRMEEVGSDPVRRAFAFRGEIKFLQDAITSVEKCIKPVIAAIHGACIGAGIDLSSTCDIRYAASGTWFSIKEVDVGLAADIGTLQRLPKVIGNESLARELVYSARKFNADEALGFGFISRVLPDEKATLDAAMRLAADIATKSPVAVQGSKHCLNFARDHTVDEGLEQMITWNSCMLQSEDSVKAVTAVMTKEPAEFSKL